MVVDHVASLHLNHSRHGDQETSAAFFAQFAFPTIPRCILNHTFAYFRRYRLNTF